MHTAGYPQHITGPDAQLFSGLEVLQGTPERGSGVYICKTNQHKMWRGQGAATARVVGHTQTPVLVDPRRGSSPGAACFGFCLLAFGRFCVFFAFFRIWRVYVAAWKLALRSYKRTLAQ